MPDSKSLSAAYRRAGEDFLATRLEGMFREIKTPDDIALHNVILKEVMLMIDDTKKGEALMFYRILAHSLLEKEAKRGFLKKVAKSIFSVAKG